MSGTQYTIYIVEDDEVIASLLCDNLGRWGFRAVKAKDFNAIDREAAELSPHLVILDVSLPFFNGFYWCAELRKRSDVPILFLSSRTDNMDVVMAVNMGGDDYITKPFSTDIVVAKINALLRRAYDYGEATRSLTLRGATLDTGDGTLKYGGESIELTKNELRILTVLLESKGKIVSRERIMQKLWDSDSFIDDNTLTVNINRLRKKLDDAGLADTITTKKGSGYMVHD